MIIEKACAYKGMCKNLIIFFLFHVSAKNWFYFVFQFYISAYNIVQKKCSELSKNIWFKNLTNSNYSQAIAFLIESNLRKSCKFM